VRYLLGGAGGVVGEVGELRPFFWNIAENCLGENFFLLIFFLEGGEREEE